MKSQPQRLDVACTITWDSSWHVGSGQGTAEIDRLLRKRACGPRGERAPFVPGSQIKGVLRHHCERLLASLGGSVVSPHMVGRERPKEALDNFRPLAQSGLLIDRLFGSRFQGDCLFVKDAIAPAEVSQALMLHSRTAIDRVSGTARDHTLFVTEIAQAHGSPMRTSLQVRHPAGVLTQDGDGFPFEYALLLAGLLSLNALGGDKSTGLGQCRIAIDGDTVRWNSAPYPVDNALKCFKECPADGEWLLMVSMLREGQA
jgi:CRISPR/Cas system CSM-associated protein Csm3 (group 7 of RAMP superfamily)